MTVEFFTFELVVVPKSQLKVTILTKFVQKGWLKNGISSLKQIKWTPTLNSAYSNQSLYQTSLRTILYTWTKFGQVGFTDLKKKKKREHYR